MLKNYKDSTEFPEKIVIFKKIKNYKIWAMSLRIDCFVKNFFDPILWLSLQRLLSSELYGLSIRQGQPLSLMEIIRCSFKYFSSVLFINRARELSLVVCEQQRRRPGCAFAQSYHRPSYSVSYLDLLQAKFQFRACLCSLGDWFESRFVGNRADDRFCRSTINIRYCICRSESWIHRVGSQYK